MQDCIFCKILKGEIPCKKAYEDENTFAFFDINPQAPVHILIIPKVHVTSVHDLNESQYEIPSHLIKTATKLAKEHGIDKDGYRIVINTGENAGQTVHHLHVHLLGGRTMQWPPG